MVDLTPVQSRNIAAIGHDCDKNEMHVQFKNGRTGIYGNVVQKMFDEMLAAESIGGHHRSKFYGNADHPYRELKPET